MVDVFCYRNSLYVIEFFLREDKNNKKHVKYGKRTYDYRFSKIVRTCFEIMMLILQNDPSASFAFVGSPSFEGDKQIEPIDTTKRFAIYRFASINFLGKESFEQFGDRHTSCYLIASNKVDKLLIKKAANRILKSLF